VELFWDAKSFGTGLECYYKTVSKGKTLMEAKQLFGIKMTEIILLK
jgi:hypothetical protein